MALLAAPNGGYLKSPLREALVGRVFCFVDMSQCCIWVFDGDSQYLNGISGAPFLLLVLGLKRLSCFGAWIVADQGRGWGAAESAASQMGVYLVIPWARCLAGATSLLEH